MLPLPIITSRQGRGCPVFQNKELRVKLLYDYGSSIAVFFN